MQRTLVRIGWWLALSGLVGGAASIFVPWMHQLVVTGSGRRAQSSVESITVLNMPYGLWYVLFLCSLFALVGTAAMGVGRGRKLAGVAGPILSLLTACIVVGLIITYDGKAPAGGRITDTAITAGSWLGLASLPLLGFACGLIAIGRAGLYDADHVLA
ncbi:hypothetical protein GCM10018962_12180 [Dactylosporangium matsuzakiense]|uniref:Uncharacterized protein n=1 Tax=Dactylosporangium matsuzakiense TaxID=53360 RepID=A0A9W6NNN5_9ACTN|nr:hypothetical protein GCM10017581_053900 [Dactylosporangium matsuzakiense]